MKKELILIACAINFYSTCAFSQPTSAENTEKYPLSKTINSPYIEARPMISHDGSTLYFCRRYHPENVNGEKDKQDIWYSLLLENGEWSTAKNLKEPINNKKANALISISPDGKEGIFINSYEKLGIQTTKVLVRSSLQEDKWAEPELVTIYNYSNKGMFADFYYSYTDNVLLLAIQKKDEKEPQGGQDLYVSIPNENGNFGEPLNLGKIINTGKDEYAPFLGSDGKSLFFVSEGHATLGGGDIFYAKRLDDSWTNWTVPENLGAPINSRNEESYFSITYDFEEIFFESYRKRALNRNIFKASLPEKFRPIDESLQPLALRSLNNEENSMRVPNAQTDNRITGEGELEANPGEAPIGTGKQTLEMNSNFIANQGSENSESEKSIPLTSSMNNEAVAINPAIVKNKAKVSTAKPTQIKEDTNRLAIKSGLSEKLMTAFDDAIIVNNDNRIECQLTKNIYFTFNSTEINKEFLPRLNKINQILSEEDGLILQIEGHADAIGNKQINRQISDLRAKQISKFLTEKGKIRPDKIVIRTHGEEDPMATNDDNKEGRELNRRVSLKFILP